MRVAIIHDWLVTIAGAEKVLSEIIKIYPNADIFAVVDFLSDHQRKFISGKKKPPPHLYKNYPKQKKNTETICRLCLWQ